MNDQDQTSPTTAARQAMAAGPSYFLAWYTVKSLALVAAFGALMYMVGREHGRNGK